MSWYTSDRLERLPSDWDSIRAKVLRRDPVCKDPEGCTAESEEADHIERGDDHRLANLQGLCSHHHAKKSAREGNDAKARLKALRKRPVERHPGRI